MTSFHHLGQLAGSREGCQQMHVVLDTTYDDGLAIEVTEDAAQVTVKRVAQGHVAQERSAIFGREDGVQDALGKRKRASAPWLPARRYREYESAQSLSLLFLVLELTPEVMGSPRVSGMATAKRIKAVPPATARVRKAASNPARSAMDSAASVLSDALADRARPARDGLQVQGRGEGRDPVGPGCPADPMCGGK